MMLLPAHIPNPENFPLHAMGSLQYVIADIYAETRSPISAIVSALLPTLSLAFQGRISVQKHRGLVSPTTLWFITEQNSGERKTSLVKRVSGAINSFSSTQNAEYEKSFTQHLSGLFTWKSKVKGVNDTIRKKAAKGIPVDTEEALLKELFDNKPLRPKPFKLLIEKITPEAIVSALSESLPTTALISDEGGIITNGRALLDLSILCKAWDGSDIIVDSVSNGTKVARNPTLTLALFLQRQVLEQYLNRKGEHARGTGFLARTYVVQPPTTAGSRFLAHSVESSGVALQQFDSRILEVLNEQISADGQNLPEKLVAKFAPDAQLRWEGEHDLIESHMVPGGFFYNFKDFGSKHADKIARLAAILEYYETGRTIISLETLERAIAISNWYAGEFVRYFTPPLPPMAIPTEQLDADVLHRWLANHVRITNQLAVRKTDLRSGGPNSLRNITRLNTAIQILSQRQIVWEGTQTGGKAIYVFMNPSFFTAERIAQLCQTPATGRSIL